MRYQLDFSFADAVLTVRHGSTLQYLAEVKRRLTPSLVGPISLAFAMTDGAEAVPGLAERVVVRDRVSEVVDEKLRRERARNAWLHLGQSTYRARNAAPSLHSSRE